MALNEPQSSPLLLTLARRVRELRRKRGWSRGELARHSGLSVRFLARIESGEGNVSVVRLESLAHALGSTPDRLVRPDEQLSAIVALVGLRGAGKSTVGPRVAEMLERPFVELDERIAETSGLTLDQIFELHGEQYYRRLEQDALLELLARGTSMVVAAGGGIVTQPDSWELLRNRTIVVWLRARPEDHWNRVVAQGDHRPMADHPAAMDELRSLLRSRENVYGEARITIDTTGQRPGDVAERVVERVRECVKLEG